MTDLSGEIHDIATAVEELEDQLATSQERVGELEHTVDQLNQAIEHLQEQVIWAEADEEAYELLADFRRGLINVDELLERTVGR
jgi:septal ring factor EnvC (AmiA/AmiB activator)